MLYNDFRWKGPEYYSSICTVLLVLKKLSFNNDNQLKIDGFDLLIYNWTGKNCPPLATELSF